MEVIICFYSILLYLSAPSGYTLSFCALNLGLFLFMFVRTIYSNKHIEKLGFNLIFSITYMIAVYVYPVFVYSIDKSFSLFQFGYNEGVINKATALATLAYSFYNLGFNRNIVVSRTQESCNPGIFCDTSIKKIFNTSFIVTILFILTGGRTYFLDRYQNSTMSVNYVFQCVLVLFSAIIPLLAISLMFIKSKKQLLKSFALLLFIVLMIISTGSRTIPLGLLLIAFVIFIQKKNYSWSRIGIFMLLGVAVMSTIGFIRTAGVSFDNVANSSELDNGLGGLNYVSDIFITTRNLYDAIDYVNHNSITYGITFLGPILSVVPFLQSMTFNLLGIPYYMTNSAALFTYLLFGSQPPIGVGTNIVADVYIATGLIGTIVLFYILGYFISYARNKMLLNKESIWTVVYLVMISDSVFICRGLYFENIKAITWCIVLLYIFNRKAYAK